MIGHLEDGIEILITSTKSSLIEILYVDHKEPQQPFQNITLLLTPLLEPTPTHLLSCSPVPTLTPKS